MVEAVAAAAVQVLVLEDHPIVRDGLALNLSAAGMAVSVASTSQEFFSKLRSASVDVAIVDLDLQDLAAQQPRNPEEGMNVLAMLAEDFPDVRPIIFTADTRPEVQARCEQLGSWSYLTKLRAEPSEVVVAVQRVASGERYLGELRFVPPAGPPVRRPQLDNISPRELQVLAYVSVGADNMKIAAHLDITERTVRAHVSSLYLKLGSENRTQLALLAGKLGVRPPRGY